MPTRQQQQFSQRMSRITQRHSRLSRGYVTTVAEDGLVVAKPKARGRKATLRGVAIMVAVIFVFKAALYANLGPVEYNARVDGLAEGSLVEQGGAFVMTADPLTVWVSGLLVSLVR